jgi:tetratricopeptide (TPR) repeat protein
VYVGFSLCLIAALAVPGFGQAKQPQARTQAEYQAYTALFNEKVPQKKAELGEKFIVDYKDSDFIAPSYRMIITAYATAQNWAKVMDAANRAASSSVADNTLKGFAYGNAMVAAQQTNDVPKIIEYGEKVLTVDPNDPNALLTLSSVIPNSLPNDPAQKTAALDKAANYANKASGIIEKLAGQLSAQQKADVEGQIHSTLGFIALNRQDYPKAVTEYEIAIKSVPKDGVAHFRLGLAYQYLAAAASKQTVEAINKLNAAKTAKAPQPEIDELDAAREAIQNDFQQKRDKAIDELATAVAFGGVVADPAKAALEPLYKTKNNDSLEGLQALIDSKK